MRVPPASVKNSWPTPNYVNPEVRGNGLYIALFTLSIVVLAAVLARFYARLVVRRW
jgi:hypothetical protein